MTSSDSGAPDPEEDNPFDLGLPMLRPPVRESSRRRPARRGGRRRRPPPARPAAPLPVPGTGDDRSGGWEEWLDQTAPQPDSPITPPPPADRQLTRAYDHSEEGPAHVPQLVDRSGGSAGSRLRRTRSRRPEDSRARRDKVLSLLILAGVGVVVVAVVLTVLHSGNRPRTTASANVPAVVEDTAGAAAPPPTAPASAAPVATADCEQRHDADEVSGTDPGGTSSGPDAILAFERAYYVQRSGSAARAVVTDDATVTSASAGASPFPAAETIQRGINEVPVGTRYCVQVTRGGTDGTQWEVRLTQQQPGEQPHTFTQIVTTRTIADRTLIAAIKEG